MRFRFLSHMHEIIFRCLKLGACHHVSGAPRGFEDLGRMAIYFQGAGEHW